MTNHSRNGTEETFPICVVVLLHIMYNLVLVMAVVGNFLVVYVVVTLPRMRTATSFLLTNLACGDLLMCLLCVPFTYISILLNYWPFGTVLCHLVSPANATCVLVSSFTLVALAIERYVAILHPLKPRLRKKQALFIIGCIWTLAFITATPIAIVTNLQSPNNETTVPLCIEDGWPETEDDRRNWYNIIYSFGLLVLQYVFPVLVLIFTYTKIAIVVWGKCQNVIPLSNQQLQRTRPYGKAVIVTFAVVIGYTIAWLPLNLFTVYTQLGVVGNGSESDETLTIKYIFVACHWIAMSHTMYNPFIYAWINQKYREAFKLVIESWMEKCSELCDKDLRDNISDRRNSVWMRKSSRSSDCCLNDQVIHSDRKGSAPLISSYSPVPFPN